jgi:hypothetical protein
MTRRCGVCQTGPSQKTTVVIHGQQSRTLFSPCVSQNDQDGLTKFVASMFATSGLARAQAMRLQSSVVLYEKMMRIIIFA